MDALSAQSPASIGPFRGRRPVAISVPSADILAMTAGKSVAGSVCVDARTRARFQRRSYLAMKQSRPFRRSHSAAASALERPATRRT